MKSSLMMFWCLLGACTVVMADSDVTIVAVDKKEATVSSFVDDVVSKGTSIALKIVNNDKNESDNFNEVWEETFDLFKDGGALEAEYGSVPESALIKRDKGDVEEDINEILDDVIDILTDGRYASFREESKKLKEKVKDLKFDIVEYREKKVSAPISSMLSTTQEGYEQKIKNANDDINTYRNEQEVLKGKLKQYFIRSGIQLNSEQVDTLLSSVDGDDMIKMTLVLKVLNRITDQLMSILEDSNEELSFAKKYYAMHLLSFDLVVHIYQKYIDKVDKVYLVKLKNIMNDTTEMLSVTHTLLEKEVDNNRKIIYGKNIEAQELTQKAVMLYIRYLVNNKNKIVETQKIAKQNLNLARNTYNTVTLSAQLQSIMTDNKRVFNKLLSIQMPDIVPFENTQLKLKYQELTNQLEEDY